MTQDTESDMTSEQDAQRNDLGMVEQVREAVRRGDLEVPTGAEDIVLALRASMAEYDELFGRFQRLAADFANFQRRASTNEREARSQATIGAIRSVIPVMDQFDLALGQDSSKSTAEQIVGGVRMIRDELMRVLAGFGVTAIEPKPNDEFDPAAHEAMLQQASPEVDPGRVVQTFGVGYRMGDRVIRPAKVSVAAVQTSRESGQSEGA
ncbi:MAG: nucleotide exchange factor GrpE [Phycisphaeraceae bacterium]|nr:nucleotide exchange factor GrpE [Phycisphaeraceae bacterium]MCW5764107.1 nucleotide exchange factor GrpE [Phycisphaeraceae bacterium]